MEDIGEDRVIEDRVLVRRASWMFHVQLPRTNVLIPRWERAAGFNAHSKIMYDFLYTNNLIAADLLFTQPLLYSIFCISRNTFTWIDQECFAM